jgi:hypothetical protein
VITDNKYLMIGAAAAGLALAYMVTKGAGKVVDMVGDAAQAINPQNNDNIINKGFTSIYQGATGSAGTIGGDFYDAFHGGVLIAAYVISKFPAVQKFVMANSVMVKTDDGQILY